MILFWGARKVIQFQGGIIPSSYIGFSHLFLIPTLVHSWALSRPPPPPRLQVNLVNFYWQFLPSYLCTAFYISLGHLKWNEVKSLSSVLPFTTPWTVADQAPPSMGFSRQEYWSGVPKWSIRKQKQLIKNFFMLIFFLTQDCHHKENLEFDFLK